MRITTFSRNPTSARPASNNPFMPALSPRAPSTARNLSSVYIFSPASAAACWTVELGELGYFTPSLSCTRQATDKKELRAASIALRGLNFRLGREFYKDLKGKMQLERCPQSASAPASSADEALGVEQRWQLLDEYLQQYPCINRSQYARLAGRSYKQAVVDLNRFIEEGVLMRHGMGPSVVYARKR